MRLLALDTATEACSVALWLDGAIDVETIELGHGHARRILPMVDARLAAHRLRLADLDAIAAGRGPGGFTGVRLGVSVAQGLAFGAGLPTIGISDLAAVAQAVFDRDAGVTHVLVANDARMKEVYTALFRRGEDGLAVPEGAERVLPPDAVSIAVPEGACVVGAGRGFRAHPRLAGRLAGQLSTVDAEILPDAGAIARLAAAAFAAGQAGPPESLQPVYLRDEVAVPAVMLLQ